MIKHFLLVLSSKKCLIISGNRIAKGSVLVKRIQIDSDQEPSVILEQNGVEVIKPVKSTNSPIASLQ
jgi:hypothetical protein